MPDVEARSVEYHRDTAGTLFAVETIHASTWRNSFLTPPPIEEADARIVRIALTGASPLSPGETPSWLFVERNSRGVADLEAGYAVDDGPAAGATERRLWLASPHWRDRRAPLRAYLDAALAALATPDAVAEALLQGEPAAIDALGRFADERSDREPWHTLAAAQGAAFERWLQASFPDPDALADETLLERLGAEGEAEAVRLLRYLRGARIVEDTPERVELGVDQRALLEQASPWRHFESGDLAAAWPAVRTWMARYRADYERWYQLTLGQLDEVRRALAVAEPQRTMLSRLDGIESLGRPDGAEASAHLERISEAIEALPPTADPDGPTTGGLALGGSFELEVEAERALELLAAASERRQRRLASALASIVMGRADVEPIDRVLQALLAADLDDLDRVLNADVLAQIESLLDGAGTAAGPLSQLLARYDEVRPETIDDVVVAFRMILEEGLEASDSVALR
jgi:hypothetical protein